MTITDKPNIILVEDDIELASLVGDYLSSQQFNVTQLHEGLSAVDTIISQNPDLVILDLMLPDKDGMSICRECRAAYHGPILMLTASDDMFDQVAGLETGADDYVQKPVEPRVLLARVRALLRRNQSAIVPKAPKSRSDKLTFKALSINRSARQVTLADRPVELTTPEFDILDALAENAGTVLSREKLFKLLKNYEYDGQNRFIDITISHIRKKLGNDADRYLKTVRGKGYMLVID